MQSLDRSAARLSAVSLLFFISFLLTACAGGGGGGGEDSQDPGNSPLTGVLVDSPISGIHYATTTFSGTTNSGGEFKYLEGETITFSIGDIVFPAVTALTSLSPLDLAGTTDTSDTALVNMTRLLQTLDQDGDPTNGIKIHPAVHDAAVGTSVDFASLTFDTDVADLLDTIYNLDFDIPPDGPDGIIPSPTLVDETTAISHLSSSVTCTGNLRENIVGHRVEVGGGQYVQYNLNGSFQMFDGDNVLTGTYTVAGLTVTHTYSQPNPYGDHHSVFIYSTADPIEGTTFNAITYADAGETDITEPANDVSITAVFDNTVFDAIYGNRVEVGGGQYVQYNPDGSFQMFDGDNLLTGTYSAAGLTVTHVYSDPVLSGGHHSVFTYSTANPTAGDTFNAVTYIDAAETSAVGTSIGVSITAVIDNTVIDALVGNRVEVGGGQYAQYNPDGTFEMYDGVSTVTGIYSASGLTVKHWYDGDPYALDHDAWTFSTANPIEGSTFHAVEYGDIDETDIISESDVAITAVTPAGSLCL